MAATKATMTTEATPGALGSNAQSGLAPERAVVAYLYHDADTPEDAHPWLHSTMLVLAADRRPTLRNETPLVTLAQAEAMVAADRAESARLRHLLNLARDDYNTAAQRLQEIGDYAHDHSTGPAERDRLRAAQAEAVMPLIGPLLDAWECGSQSLRSEHPELDKHLRRINRAMEDAGDERPNVQIDLETTAWKK